jgi:hypothetical protein
VRLSTRWLSATASVALAASSARADDKAPPIQDDTQWIGAFFDVGWTEDTTTNRDGAKVGEKETSLGGDASYGYCLTHHWALSLDIGGRVGIKTTYMQDIDGGNTAPKTTDKTFFIAPTVRYYMRARDDTYFFLQGRVSVLSGTLTEQQYQPTTNTITTIDYDQIGIAARFSPGLSVFVSDHFAAEALIGAVGFGIQRANDGNGNRRQRDNVEAVIFASSINIGFAYYFTP